MSKHIELWQFISDRLARAENVMLLVVAESSGSSPGRAGYKMAVTADGDLYGSIGGGVMEVRLVEEAKSILSKTGAIATGSREQVHQRNSPQASGMICSGRQTVIFKLLTPENAAVVHAVIQAVRIGQQNVLHITSAEFELWDDGDSEIPNSRFEKLNDVEFRYQETLGSRETLYIIGGGHCALALSEVMAKLDFRITIFDDRPELNTIAKNDFADEITIIDDYSDISPLIPDDTYVVIMTVGYASDRVVIKQLCDRNFKYLGVLGSKAKMSTLMKELKDEGIHEEHLTRIRTPIGIHINSRTPEEIAISIAAEIIAVKNAK